jgi:AcrR family transcriptional regulator
MGIIDRREREKQMRRDSIVDAAEKFFFTKGVSATTMDEIAETAELSKGTLYLYFKNKEEIYIAIVRRSMTILRGLFQQALASAPTGLAKVEALGKAMFTCYEKHPNHFTALFYHHENVPCDELAFDCGDPVIKGLLRDGEELSEMSVETIQAGIADGTIRPDIDPKKASLSLSSMILGLIRMISVEEKYLLKSCCVNGRDLIEYAFVLIKQALELPRP